MAGNANSGRKTRYEKIQEGNLLDICTTWLVQNFHTFNKDTKIKVAIEIAKKGVIQRHEVKGVSLVNLVTTARSYLTPNAN